LLDYGVFPSQTAKLVPSPRRDCPSIVRGRWVAGSIHAHVVIVDDRSGVRAAAGPPHVSSVQRRDQIKRRPDRSGYE
jgi:hypothetical protein